MTHSLAGHGSQSSSERVLSKYKTASSTDLGWNRLALRPDLSAHLGKDWRPRRADRLADRPYTQAR